MPVNEMPVGENSFEDAPGQQTSAGGELVEAGPSMTGPSVGLERRILAIYLPRLLSEVAEGGRIQLPSESQRSQHALARGIVLVDSETDNVKSTDVLHAVCLRAHRAGIKPGQTLAEARALIADLRVDYVQKEDVEAKIVAIAEVIAQFGPTISWEFPDTIWIDVTGVAHLFGGEDSLCQEVQEQVRLLGHVARVCIASGPWIARAIARYGGLAAQAVAPEETRRCLKELPLLALPLSQEKVAWFSQLGLFTIGQLRDLPKKTASSRLGEGALQILELMEGRDRTPLTPGEFPRRLTEEVEWEEPAHGSEPLLFALRGLIAKVSARLRGRGEACSTMELTLRHDPAYARHRGVLSQTLIEFEFASPLSRETDLERALRSRIERLATKAPTIGLRLEAHHLSPETMDQMNLAESAAAGLKNESPALWNTTEHRKREFAILLSELSADVGTENVGILGIVDSHRLEARSVLWPMTPQARGKNKKRKIPAQMAFSSPSRQKAGARKEPLLAQSPSLDRVTRVYERPQLIKAPLALGESFGLGGELYTIEGIRFIERLDGVEWWTPRSTSRDYFWVWLKSPNGGTEALCFIDRNTQQRYVQALGD